ncbi:MAG: CobW family GTP-binding protein [Comamonas sp.]
MPSHPIPLTVIGGFLGAGKTSLLNHLLRTPDMPRCAVLVNDFGAINLDAGLLAGVQGDTIALTNGCVCCSIGDDLSNALIQVLAADPPFDSIVVEASGISDPWRIAQIGLADPDLRLESVVVVVDCDSLLLQAEDPLLRDGLRQQLVHADLLVLNKADLATPAQMAQVLAWCQSACPQAVAVQATQGEVDPALLGSGFGQSARPRAAATGDAERFAGRPIQAPQPSRQHAQAFETWSASTAALPAFGSEALRSNLAPLAGRLLRLKGHVRTLEHGWAEVQFAGRRINFRRLAQAPDPALQQLVAIGLGGQLPREQLAKLFSA